ncbi:MAG: 50S ribosomal protein L18 [Thaumarchaeota archaeon]|jgi:large subunit ribosomal protein L18|nr:50S ribosomal protein L18 [Candidatus Geocrenenecus arthurdayi]MCL7388860.1 50S ribosomal protein L18 [Candidatus Geocrenenecus arthurdayi]MCL7391805.1 50S ribosomal protein L18 [Candidatus Geocrenenecus arthurdayi]MCL7396384.1 50S ribosomal protein L18 [Candidatus Geocrenenecus arthurdayi]MCL7401860.1 50S ribosomal protein L18 [Candidatus Geocrenenecus arthurdayi]
MSRLKILKRRPPRRRREGVTDYRVRLKLVKSNLPRLVIRKSNRYIIIQLVESRVGGDKTLITVTSKHLLDYGWRAGTKNLPAAYLTGFLAGLLAKKKGVEKAVVDIGLYTPVSGSRIFAAVKGFTDAGIDVKVGGEKLPREERIKGTHIQEYYQMIRERNIETIQFSKSPEDVYTRLAEHFEEVREKIAQRVGGA